MLITYMRIGQDMDHIVTSTDLQEERPHSKCRKLQRSPGPAPWGDDV